MSTKAAAMAAEKKRLLSLDSWAVIVAFLAALLIRIGVFRHIPW